MKLDVYGGGTVQDELKSSGAKTAILLFSAVVLQIGLYRQLRLQVGCNSCLARRCDCKTKFGPEHLYHSGGLDPPVLFFLSSPNHDLLFHRQCFDIGESTWVQCMGVETRQWIIEDGPDERRKQFQ